MSERLDSENEMVLEHYRQLRERFITQGTRLWTRFHYFLTIEAALVGAYVTTYRIGAVFYLALSWTALWLIIAVQDLWFYEQSLQRMDLFKAGQIIPRINGWSQNDEEADYPIRPRWKRLLCFRIPHVGVTTFASATPLLFLLSLCVIRLSMG